MYPQVLKNVKVDDKAATLADPAVQAAVEQCTADLGDGTEVEVDVEQAENAALMASEAGLHMEASPLIDNVAQLGQKVATEADTHARNDAFIALKTSVDQLYDAMYKAAKDDDFKNFKVAYDNFWENVNMIKYDDYGKLAASYNNLISGVPGSLVAGITGQGTLNTFGG